MPKRRYIEPYLFYHSDHLGSAAYLTDENGQVTQTLNYLPYGEDWVDIQHNLDPSLIQYRFNGKEKDYESGFHYYGARYYWSELLTGWLSVDPMSDKYPGISSYAYCDWNPIKYVDLDGEEKLIFFNTQMPVYSSYRGEGVFGQYMKAIGQYVSNVNLKNSANRYKDHSDVIHLFAHGNSTSINLAEKGRKHAEGLEFFLLNNSEVYREGLNKGEVSLLIMHSCKTGSGRNSIAQQLSKNTEGNLLVIAPSENVIMGKDENVKNDGIWNVFYKGELVGSYKGTTDFRKELEGKNAQTIIKRWTEKYKREHAND